eukprot:GHVO01035469.1.p2 GENE.GHVO01035469.1~~GHVO01035469.1.p2  ORF type:complete len:101 (+),score=7.34 GHVO01035469.1:264-566(+)
MITAVNEEAVETDLGQEARTGEAEVLITGVALGAGVPTTEGAHEAGAHVAEHAAQPGDGTAGNRAPEADPFPSIGSALSVLASRTVDQNPVLHWWTDHLV